MSRDFEFDKETRKAIEALSKIEKDEWRAMAETTKVLNSIVSLGGASAIVSQLKESVTETIKLQVNSLLSPIQNEFNQAITDFLAPIMPFLTESINTITDLLNVGFGAIDALLTGKWDDYLRNLKLDRQDEVDAYQKTITDNFWGGSVGRTIIEIKLGVDLLALEASARAGGVYSGQFDDLDYDVINDILRRQGLIPLEDF